ncbi:lactonase family protein [Agrilactobacillus fermenti]|uniref:lactonase family protein n=1 Tax=Agrilactobacillus fermenti TaxID=2586909 RepID=UPI001E2AC495|nr:lactonase family protein [Agrilactobacillus fermenti]MCD2257277.1 lactonase family protein [Agrilactobacillus fermenti]
MKETVLLGGYTRRTGKGIYQGQLENNQLHDITPYIEIGGPTYFTVDEKNQRLFTIMTEGDQGGVAAYDLSGAQPKLISKVLQPGASPAYIAYDPNRQLLFDANYHKGLANAYRIAPDGQLALLDTLKHHGSGPKPEQDSAHVHYINLTPDQRLIVCDLGIDQVSVYDFEADHFKPIATYQTQPGFGPRHVVFNPNQSVVYLLGELSSQVTVLDYNVQTGALTPIQTESTIPDNFTAHNGSAAIRISADGKFLYASNRGHNSITVFNITADGRHIDLIQRISTEGDFPRDFNLDPSQKFILAANQNSDNLTLYTRNPDSGFLTLLEKDISCPEIVCVNFLKA